MGVYVLVLVDKREHIKYRRVEGIRSLSMSATTERSMSAIERARRRPTIIPCTFKSSITMV
jgi:hypothetical protein